MTSWLRQCSIMGSSTCLPRQSLPLRYSTVVLQVYVALRSTSQTLHLRLRLPVCLHSQSLASLQGRLCLRQWNIIDSTLELILRSLLHLLLLALLRVLPQDRTVPSRVVACNRETLNFSLRLLGPSTWLLLV